MCMQCDLFGATSRRDLLKLSAVLTAAGALPLLRAGEARAQAKDEPVRIGYLPITDAAPLLVAHANGYFTEQGLQADKPTLLRSWAQVIEAFISGQVNVVHLLSPMAVWARFSSKVPAKMVAWNHVDGSALTVANDVNTLADLGGKTVAVPFWYSIHNVVLQDLLRRNGLNPLTKPGATPGPKDVQLVVMAPSDMPPALVGKQIAGYIVAEPFNAAAEALGVGKVLRFTGDVWKNHACCVVFMHERDLQQRPDWSQKVLNGIVKAQLWTREHRAEAAQLLSKEGEGRYTPHAPDVLKRVLAPPAEAAAAYAASGAIKHADWNEQRIDFQPYPYRSYVEELVKRLKATSVEADRAFLDQLDPAFAARDLIDDRFVKTAIQAQGGLRAFGLPDAFERNEVITG